MNIIRNNVGNTEFAHNTLSDTQKAKLKQLIHQDRWERQQTGLLISKILITILVVIIIAEIAKRSSPLLGGLLLGLPLGVGLSVFFIAYSEGVPFIIKSVPWGIAGLAPSILFCFFYLLGGKVLKFKSRSSAILFSSLLGLIAFSIAAYILSLTELTLLLSVLIFAAVFIINIAAIKKIGLKSAVTAEKNKSNTIMTFLIRGVFSAAIIVAITGVASVVGNRWAGVLSAFPSTTYSLLLVLHFESGDAYYPSIIKGFSISVSTLAVFYILCYALLPALGLVAGFIAAYMICIVFLLGVKLVSDKINSGSLTFLKRINR